MRLQFLSWALEAWRETLRQPTNVPNQIVFSPTINSRIWLGDDDDDEDDDDVNAADTCSLGLLQRPGGQKIRQIKRNACHFQQPVMMLFSVFYFFCWNFSVFFRIFSTFQYCLVFFSISPYFSVFSVLFSIFRVFQYFRYFLVIFSIRQIKRISCHFQQPVMMLRKTFSKKKEEDYCIVKLLHEYPIAFFLFFKFQKQEVSNVRLLSTLPPLSVTWAAHWVNYALAKIKTKKDNDAV